MVKAGPSKHCSLGPQLTLDDHLWARTRSLTTTRFYITFHHTNAFLLAFFPQQLQSRCIATNFKAHGRKSRQGSTFQDAIFVLGLKLRLSLITWPLAQSPKHSSAKRSLHHLSKEAIPTISLGASNPPPPHNIDHMGFQHLRTWKLVYTHAGALSREYGRREE